MHRMSRMAFALLLAAPLTLAGCGGETAANKPGDEPQPRTEQTITPEQLLEGQWQGQMVLDEETEKNLHPDKVENLRALTMAMEFKPGGVLILAGVKANGKGDDSEGAWEVLSVKDNQITIKTIEASGKETEAVLMFETDDSFLMPLKTEVANLGAMRFERLK